MTLYAATTNPGKLAEFAQSASADGITVLPLPGLRDLPEPVENATTFVGNAEIKARAYSLFAPGLLVFADDSGLAVDALGGAPGVRSARFADEHHFTPDSATTTDARNNALLLSLLVGHPAPHTAHFICALALARDGEVFLRAEGSVAGEILPTPRGTNGFGYDPLFLLPSLRLTTAELSSDQKWTVSHRGTAFRALLAQLKASVIA